MPANSSKLALVHSHSGGLLGLVTSTGTEVGFAANGRLPICRGQMAGISPTLSMVVKSMSGKKPQLITFGISHFCEKARWALDWHGVEYNEIGWPPGLHFILAKRLGAKASTLPILRDGKRVIQGSGAIIDWADQRAQDASRLTIPGAREIERRADRSIGIHARRFAYAEMLPKAPKLVKPALFANTSTLHRLIGNMMWPVTRKLMMQKFAITPDTAELSRVALDAELDWLDSVLSDGRRYLAGGRFSRADITVASLLAPFARPEQMKTYCDIVVPETLAAAINCWKDRPIMRWTVELYRLERPIKGGRHDALP